MKRILLICLAALFCTPASALADNGTVISITPSAGQFLGTYSVSVTVPDSVGYYGGYGYAWQVGPTEVCDPNNYAGGLVWVGNVMNGDAPDTFTGSDTFVPNGASFKICLGISRAEAGRQLVAEQVYNAPAPASAPAPTPAPTSPTAPVSDPGKAAATCTYWTTQESTRGRAMKSAKAAYSKAKKSYRKKRTSARRRAMNRARQKFNTAETKLKTAERKGLAACA
jgi:nucleoid-associated protein YgaU